MNDDQKAKFRKEAFIPDDVGLELEHFEEFYEKRKDLLAEKIPSDTWIKIVLYELEVYHSARHETDT